jgi:hypothetical protein
MLNACLAIAVAGAIFFGAGTIWRRHMEKKGYSSDNWFVQSKTISRLQNPFFKCANSVFGTERLIAKSPIICPHDCPFNNAFPGFPDGVADYFLGQ